MINDLVFYYTDGVIDTSNSLGQRFEEERLIKTLTKLCEIENDKKIETDEVMYFKDAIGLRIEDENNRRTPSKRFYDRYVDENRSRYKDSGKSFI